MLHIIQITDFHLFADPQETLKGVNTLNSLSAVVRDCRRRYPAPDLVLVTGDVSHDGSAASYQQCGGILADLAAPVMFLPGNHDVVSVMQQEFPSGRISNERCQQLNGWNIIMLNTAMHGEEGGFLVVDELAFLDEMLQNWPNYPALVALHHPPVVVGSRWLDAIGLVNVEEFFDVLDRHPQVRGVIFGHIHQVFEMQRKGVHLMGTPSTCIQFMPNEGDFAQDHQKPGYRHLTLHVNGEIETGVARIA
ncbi:MAG: 3',5'-cyclic-AMP phosphodiesterase [Mariprofundaceae bacterium]|nr:3',5'-cyclic-AMP phosphodiesterase [Mariprofundaceae bacterium]